MVFLETERLRFRTHERHDEAAFVAMQTDAAVRQFVGAGPWPHDKAVRRFRTQYVGKPDDTYGLWATICKADGAYIGCCGLSGGRDDAHLAYYIAAPYWGRGFASEAARAFVQAAFDRLRLARIAATVTKGHAASERILTKIGFVYVSEEEVGDAGRAIRTYELRRDAATRAGS